MDSVEAEMPDNSTIRPLCSNGGSTLGTRTRSGIPASATVLARHNIVGAFPLHWTCEWTFSPTLVIQPVQGAFIGAIVQASLRLWCYVVNLPAVLSLLPVLAPIHQSSTIVGTPDVRVGVRNGMPLLPYLVFHRTQGVEAADLTY